MKFTVISYAESSTSNACLGSPACISEASSLDKVQFTIRYLYVKITNLNDYFKVLIVYSYHHEIKTSRSGRKKNVLVHFLRERCEYISTSTARFVLMIQNKARY